MADAKEQTQDQQVDAIEEMVSENDSSYRVKLAAFEGPLDLLLHLIKTAKIKIEDIFVSEITEQYMSYMNEISELDLDAASEFIEMAAWLLEIKSRSLLPKPQEEAEQEDDPKKELIRRLEEYNLYKEACAKMKEQEAVGMHFRAPDAGLAEPHFVLKDMNMEGLMQALQKMFLKLEKRSITKRERHITLDRFTVTEKMSHIKDFMLLRETAKFDELFEADYTKSEIITTFQALLELLKLQFITATQKEVFGEILIRKVA
ncbi:MAG: segregation/condensation protein A, partial [Clostridiales bacterium]|nr:segregation/condensation protein A [Clostridiales bacterium]